MLNSVTFSHKYSSYLLAALVLITLAVFTPVMGFDFIAFDDDTIVYANPYLQSGVTYEMVRWAFTSGYEANWIPLSMIVHALIVQLFGLNPAAHHAINVLFHVASACLLFQVFKRATNDPWQSLAVAFLFALHPLHVESVVWIAELKDVLSNFFLMFTLVSYQRYAEKPGVGIYVATLSLFVLGLLSKPMLVTVPFLLLLLDWWPLGRIASAPESGQCNERSSMSRLLAEKIPFFMVSVCSSIITYRVQHADGELSQGYTLLSRLGKACLAYTTYLCKMIWPVDLAILYPFSKYPPSSGKIFIAALGLLLITVVTIYVRKRYPFFVTGWIWYLASLLPVIGLVQIGQHSVADRYTYIPLIGLFVMLAWGVPQLLGTWRFKTAALWLIVIVTVIGLIPLTVRQIGYWKNSETLFRHTLEVTQGNWVIDSNLGLVYLDEGRVDEAIWHFNRSIQAKPSYGLAHLNLGAAYLTTKQYDKAVNAFKWALQFDRMNHKAHYGLGIAYVQQGEKDLGLGEYQSLVTLHSPSAQSLLEIINSMPSLPKR